MESWLAGLKGTLFLSTLSLRRATPATSRNNKNNIFLSTLSLRRATSIQTLIQAMERLFLSTLSLRRATSLWVYLVGFAFSFLSTLSLRRATVGQKRLRQKLAISIHALLAESDRLEFCDTAPHIYFYPRSPCGERLTSVGWF